MLASAVLPLVLHRVILSASSPPSHLPHRLPPRVSKHRLRRRNKLYTIRMISVYVGSNVVVYGSFLSVGRTHGSRHHVHCTPCIGEGVYAWLALGWGGRLAICYSSCRSSMYGLVAGVGRLVVSTLVG